MYHLAILLVGLVVLFIWGLIDIFFGEPKPIKKDSTFFGLLIFGCLGFYLILQRLDELAKKIDRVSEKLYDLINRLEK
jgi:hypothetical protein